MRSAHRIRRHKLVVCAIAFVIAHPVSAANITVDSSADTQDCDCSVPLACTIRDALCVSATNGETDTIDAGGGLAFTPAIPLVFSDPDGGSTLDLGTSTVTGNGTLLQVDTANGSVLGGTFSGDGVWVDITSGPATIDGITATTGSGQIQVSAAGVDLINALIASTSPDPTIEGEAGSSTFRLLGSDVSGSTPVSVVGDSNQIGGCGAGEANTLTVTGGGPIGAITFDIGVASPSALCNTIDGATSAAAISVRENITGALIDQNVISGSAIGVAVSTDSEAVVSNNDISNAGLAGVTVDRGSVARTISGNAITNVPTGVLAIEASQTDATGNTIDSATTAIQYRASSGLIDGNTITNSATGVLLEHELGGTLVSQSGDDVPVNPTITNNGITTTGPCISGVDAVPTNINSLEADNTLSSAGGTVLDLFFRLIAFTHDESGGPVGGVDLAFEDAIGTMVPGDTTNAQGFTDAVTDYSSSDYNSEWGSFPFNGGGFLVCPVTVTATSGTLLGTVQVCPDGQGGGVPAQGPSPIPPVVTIGGSSIYTVVNIEMQDTSNVPPTVDIQNAASPKPQVDQGEAFVLDTFIEDQEDTLLSQIGVTIESDQEGVLFTGTADGSTARRPFWARLIDPIAPNLLVSTTLSQPLTLTTLGDHVLTVTATDADGASASDTLLVQVVDPGNPACGASPAFTITSPATGDTFELGDTITISVDVDDPDLPADSLTVAVSSDVDGGLGSQSGLGSGTVSFSAALTAGLHALTATVSDSCPNTVDGSVFVTVVDLTADCDGDGIPDGEEPDSDGDLIPDDCDPCPLGDQDADGACDSPSDPPCAPGELVGCTDSCPSVPNTGQEDQDGDGVGDACDNCPDVHNAGQADDDGNGVGNLCDDGTTPPPASDGACDGPCTLGDLYCLILETCDPADQPIPFGPDPTEQCFEKWVGNLTIEFQNSDPAALNTILMILAEGNRAGLVLSEEARDRIREIIDDLMSQFWPGHRPLVGDLLALERETGARDLGAPPPSNNTDDSGCEYFGGCGTIAGKEIPPVTSAFGALVVLALQRRRRRWTHLTNRINP